MRLYLIPIEVGKPSPVGFGESRKEIASVLDLTAVTHVRG